MNVNHDKQVMAELWEELAAYIRLTEQLYQARRQEYRKYKKVIFAICCELARRPQRGSRGWRGSRMAALRRTSRT